MLKHKVIQFEHVLPESLGKSRDCFNRRLRIPIDNHILLTHRRCVCLLVFPFKFLTHFIYDVITGSNQDVLLPFVVIKSTLKTHFLPSDRPALGPSTIKFIIIARNKPEVQLVQSEECENFSFPLCKHSMSRKIFFQSRFLHFPRCERKIQ